MTNPTSNFGWQMPTSTDLVTDLPADFEVFGQAVDTSMADLKGGTTGQILSKNSNTDMDFIWTSANPGDITAVNTTAPLQGGATSGAVTLSVTTATTSATGVVQLSDSTSTTSSVLAATPTAVKSAYDLANAAIPKTLTTTTGDTIYASSANTPARLGVGTTGQVLTVAGGVPTWATPGGATKNYTQIASTSLSGSSVTVSGLAGYDDVWVFIRGASSTSATPSLYWRYNASATAIHNVQGLYYGGNATSPYYMIPNSWVETAASSLFCASQTTAASTIAGYFRLTGCNTSGKKMMQMQWGVTAGQYQEATAGGGFIDTTATISSVEVYVNSGTFDAGTIIVMAAA
jgi:hypothetical protein